MDLVQLRYFLKVAELRSFTRAASELHVAQPAITRQIHLLEQELGVSVFTRHSRGAQPTEEGLVLQRGAEEILRALGALHSQVRALGNAVAGTVRFGFPPSVGLLLAGELTSRCRAGFPDIALRLRQGYTQPILDDLLSDRLDLAIVSGAVEHPSIEVEHLFDEQLWLVESTQAVRTQPENPVAVQELASRALIQPSTENLMRRILDTELGKLGLRLDVAIEVEPLDVIKDLVRRGLGCHVSPYSAISSEIAHGTLAGRPIADLHVSRHLARAVDRPLTMATRALRDLVSDVLRATVPASRGSITL